MTILGKPLPTREEQKEMEKMSDLLVWAVSGAIVTTPSTVHEITEEQKLDVTLHRLVKLGRGDVTEEATDYEVMLYISNFTLEHPPSSHIYRIYMYLFARIYPEKSKTMFGDDVVTKLDLYEAQMLRDIKRKLYQTQTERKKGR